MSRSVAVAAMSTAALAAALLLPGVPAAAVHQVPAAAPAAVRTLPVGPGPQRHYTIQRQPAPGTCHYRHTDQGQPLPDTRCTPGATSPAVTQANLARTICHPGYTRTIRPPQSVTGPEKTANIRSYHYTGPRGDAEYDHLVSLELGGDPNDPRNGSSPPPPATPPAAASTTPKTTSKAASTTPCAPARSP